MKIMSSSTSPTDSRPDKIGRGKPGPGRPKGMPNKTTALLKDAILKAATEAGQGSMVDYLKARAIDTPGPFLSLLGKVLPMQIAGTDENGNPSEIVIRVIKPER